ncbi:MAG: hypothetical protein M1826_005409 [Phylliscum demangeonii]|nr:MAG: hypothetical protein M1826_005409 [Phylliscum demangeonii]
MDPRWRWVPQPEPVVLDATRPARFRRRMASDDFARDGFAWRTTEGLFVPDNGVGLQRSRSHGHRAPPPASPPLHPAVVIQQDIRQDDFSNRNRPGNMLDPYLELELVRERERERERELERVRERERERERERDRGRRRSRSRSREFREHSRPRPFASRDPSPFHIWQQELESEHMKKELESFRKQKDREREEQRIRDDLMLRIAKEEQEKREDEERAKKLKEQAVAEWQVKERNRIEKEKQEKAQAVLEWQTKERERAEQEKQDKEKREAEYKDRLKKDFGLSDKQIEKIVDKDKKPAAGHGNALDLKRTTYTKIARKHISLETLHVFDLPYKLDDHNPKDFVVIKRWVPEHLQEQLWEHTRKLREDRDFNHRRLELSRFREEQDERLKIFRKKVVRTRSPSFLDIIAPRR